MESVSIRTKRIEEIDIVKALAIILMVVCHGGIYAGVYHFIYLFHMAVFFMASGVGYKSRHSDSIKDVLKYIKNKIIRLWLPYFVWNTIFVLLNNFFIKINVYTDNPQIFDYVNGKFISTTPYLSFGQMMTRIAKGVYFGNNTTLGGAFWFLSTLFCISCLYCVIEYVLRKIFKDKHILLLQMIVSLVFLGIGFLCSVTGHAVMGFARVFSVYCLYYLGIVFVKFREIAVIKLKTWAFAAAGIVSFGVLLVFDRFGTVSLGINEYVNPAYMLIVSAAGFILLYSVSYFIAKLKIKKAFIFLGSKTLPIVILHFLSFKLVAWIIAMIYGLPHFCIAAHPNLYGDIGVWWIAYTAVGIAIPLLIDVGYQRLIRNLKWNQYLKSII